MMFSSCYDKSLGLILKNSNRNLRNGIIDFVKNIPDGLYMDIKNKIYVSEKNRECCNDLCIFQNYKFSGNYELNDKLYYYRIDPYNYGLILGYSVIDNYKYKNVFEILLMPIDNIDDKINEDIYIGSILCGNDVYINNEVINFYLMSGLFYKNKYKFMISISSFSGIVNIGIFNIKTISDVFNLNELNSSKKVDRYVKKIGGRYTL